MGLAPHRWSAWRFPAGADAGTDGCRDAPRAGGRWERDVAADDGAPAALAVEGLSKTFGDGWDAVTAAASL